MPPPTTTALYITLNLITAMVLGVMLIGESLGVPLIVGFAFVLTGILIGNGIFGNVWTRARRPYKTAWSPVQ